MSSGGGNYLNLEKHFIRMVQEKIRVPGCKISSFLPKKSFPAVPYLAYFVSAKISKWVSPHPSRLPSPPHQLII